MQKNKVRNIKMGSMLIKRIKSENGMRKVPWLNIAGLWLLEAGFEIGETLEVTILENGVIISKKQKQ